RLFPMIAGIISLFLFLKVAQKFMTRTALPIALILFAVGEHLIYFSSEVKQYSSDVAITLLLILITFNILNKKFNSNYIILFGFIGAISFWLSNPAVFTFGAAALVLLLSIVQKKEWGDLIWLLIAGIIALVSFSVNYLISLQVLGTNKELLDAFQHSFMPLLPDSFADLKWFGYCFLRIFKNPLGLSIYELLLAVLSFFVGCTVMFYKQRKVLLILILPIILTLIASGLKKYPFEGRLLLFIAPSMFLIIAEGIDFMRIKTAKGS
ncbi:unnamed protein product, partial [marine sediment metagenome]